MKITEFKYIILNKPKGYVCALKDNLSPVVPSLISEKIKGLHIVGRLDKDTTGILILTNDGNYTHNSTHPKKHVKKVYKVSLKENISESDVAEIELGMKIDHGETLLKPGKVEVVNPKEVHLEISEGKFHQVKKMFAALNNEVLELERISFDGIKLSDFNLAQGEYVVLDKLK